MVENEPAVSVTRRSWQQNWHCLNPLHLLSVQSDCPTINRLGIKADCRTGTVSNARLVGPTDQVISVPRRAVVADAIRIVQMKFIPRPLSSCRKATAMPELSSFKGESPTAIGVEAVG